MLINISYFSFLFISRSITLTISNNSSLVNIPFSTSNRVRHYPPNRASLFYINCLSNLELAFEFVCPFIIREGAFYSNKVENLLVSTVVADVSPNQLSISSHAPYLWLTLKQKFPLTFNNLFHLFLFVSRGREPVSTYFIPYEQLHSFFGSPIT